MSPGLHVVTKRNPKEPADALWYGLLTAVAAATAASWVLWDAHDAHDVQTCTIPLELPLPRNFIEQSLLVEL